MSLPGNLQPVIKVNIFISNITTTCLQHLHQFLADITKGSDILTNVPIPSIEATTPVGDIFETDSKVPESSATITPIHMSVTNEDAAASGSGSVQDHRGLQEHTSRIPDLPIQTPQASDAG